MATETKVSGRPALRARAPGRDIAGDLLPALAISKAAFAAHLWISRNTLYKLLNEEQPVTLELALRLDKALGNGARFWLALQAQRDIWEAEQDDRIDVQPLDWKGAA
jgi:addiction module HigA family antidote